MSISSDFLYLYVRKLCLLAEESHNALPVQWVA